MQNRPRPLGAIGFLALALTLPLLASPIAAQQGGVDVTVEITNLRNHGGTVRACMTDDPERFPRCQDNARSHRVVVPAGEASVLRFHNVQPGTYAIALLHDENDNGRADRALSMIPREGFGFSRDARVRMGPPDFEEAEFTVGTTSQRQTIRMRYML